MRVYNYSEARQNFSSLLNTALNEEVIIIRKDGSKFKVVLLEENNSKSPFDVVGLKTQVNTDEILDIIRESREMV